MLLSIAWNRTAAAGRDTEGSRRGLLAWLFDVLAVCRRANAAAAHYEALQPLSDRALADKGLRRADLPRAAFDKLDEEA